MSGPSRGLGWPLAFSVPSTPFGLALPCFTEMAPQIVLNKSKKKLIGLLLLRSQPAPTLLHLQESSWTLFQLLNMIECEYIWMVMEVVNTVFDSCCFVKLSVVCLGEGELLCSCVN